MCERVFIFMNTLEYKPLCTIHGMNTSPSVLFMSINTSRRALEYCIQSIHPQPCPLRAMPTGRDSRLF